MCATVVLVVVFADVMVIGMGMTDVGMVFYWTVVEVG